MKTPIYDFLKDYAARGDMRLHMPGHKGRGNLGVEELDVTEVEGADVLYSSGGIIAESERYAEEIFGTGRTVYSTEGSSLAIRAMLFLVKKYALSVGRDATVLAVRNAHKTFMSAAALCDTPVEWIYPDGGGVISAKVTASEVRTAIEGSAVKPIALYVTAPDYLGNIPNIKEIAEVCHGAGVLLLVDNAHGAYLKFLEDDLHPITLGADMCCDSAHKTLPCLTGAAYLHISRDAPSFFADEAEGAMATFASTSPSYLILSSLDLANAELSGEYGKGIPEFCTRVGLLKKKLIDFGYSIVGDEPMKITLLAKEYGYYGYEIAEYLKDAGITVEFYDRDYLTVMPNPKIREDELFRLADTLAALPRKERIGEPMPNAVRSEAKMSIREAVFAPSELLPTEKCIGRILASAQQILH